MGHNLLQPKIDDRELRWLWGLRLGLWLVDYLYVTEDGGHTLFDRRDAAVVLLGSLVPERPLVDVVVVDYPWHVHALVV